MNNSTSPHHSAPTALSRVMDGGRFLRQWAENPMGIGAVTPSGPELTRTMASFLPEDATAPILELGPGTGVVTEAVLARGISPQQLTCLEYCSGFSNLLRQRFPGVTIVEGDAYDLQSSLGDASGFAGIISSLPLFASPMHKRRALILDALDRLEPGAPFIQFSYALVPPVREEAELFTLTKTGWIWANMPPARVWVYRKPIN